MGNVLGPLTLGSVLLLTVSALAADKVVVIPLTRTPEYTEFCEGKEAGAVAFKLDIVAGVMLNVGEIYNTDTGKLVKIVGINDLVCEPYSSVYYHQDMSFLIAPTFLPYPCYGV